MNFEKMHMQYKTNTDKILTKLFNTKLDFKGLLFVKCLLSSQKYSGIHEHVLAGVLKHKKLSNYGQFDSENAGGKFCEYKYATISSNGMISWPQIIRVGICPYEYIISIYSDDNIMMYRILGKELHNFIIYRNSSIAHHLDKDERRIGFNINSKEMDFLNQFRDTNLESLFKSSYFNLSKIKL